MTVKDQLAESGISRYFKDYLKEKSVKSISIKITKDGCDFSIVKMGSFDGAQADFRTCVEFLFKEDFFTILKEEEILDWQFEQAMKLFDAYEEWHTYLKNKNLYRDYELSITTKTLYYNELKEVMIQRDGNLCRSCHNHGPFNEGECSSCNWRSWTTY